MDTPPLTNRCVHRGAPAQRIFKKVLAIVIIWEWGTSRKADAKAWASALQTNDYRNLWHNPEPPWQLGLTDSFRRLSSCATCKMRALQTLGWDQNWGALGSIPSTTNHMNKQTRQGFQHMRRKKCSVQVGQAQGSAQLGSQPLSISWHLASTLLGRWGWLDIPFLQGCQLNPYCPIFV